jgi:hypothetical protein
VPTPQTGSMRTDRVRPTAWPDLTECARSFPLAGFPQAPTFSARTHRQRGASRAADYKFGIVPEYRTSLFCRPALGGHLIHGAWALL